MIKNKKALSTVIATVLMILLVMVATAIVWEFVVNIAKNQTEGVQSCFAATSSGKVAINDYYTCYNITSGEVQFSIDVKDVDIDSLVISILVGGNSKSFTLTNNYTVIPNLKPYKGNPGDAVKLPGKNEGDTYVADFSSEFAQGVTKVDYIRIAPIVGEKQCEQSDETNQIDSCSLFGN